MVRDDKFKLNSNPMNSETYGLETTLKPEWRAT